MLNIAAVRKTLVVCVITLLCWAALPARADEVTWSPWNSSSDGKISFRIGLPAKSSTGEVSLCMAVRNNTSRPLMLQRPWSFAYFTLSQGLNVKRNGVTVRYTGANKASSPGPFESIKLPANGIDQQCEVIDFHNLDLRKPGNYTVQSLYSSSPELFAPSAKKLGTWRGRVMSKTLAFRKR